MGYDIEKEKREAIDAGYRALQSLRAAQDYLSSASNWGLLDIFKGGFFTSMVKQSKMQQARQYIEQAKYDLDNFSRELRDVTMMCDLHLETGDFLSFADVFFDNAFVDLMVQDRISKARRQIDEAVRRVEDALRQLQRY